MVVSSLGLVVVAVFLGVLALVVVGIVLMIRLGKEPRPPRAVLPPNVVTCPDCGNPVSKQAVTCPRCGRPLNPSEIA